MLNPYITLPQAKKILDPRRVAVLTGALRNALSTWNTALAPAQMMLNSSARAMNINQMWYFFVGLGIDDDPSIILSEDQLQKFLVIDERVILRFKLIDRNFASRNYPTIRANQWRLQYSLPSLPQCERLEMGYRLDITGTEVQDAFIILRYGDTILWLWQIWGDKIDNFEVQLKLGPKTGPEPMVFDYDTYAIGG